MRVLKSLTSVTPFNCLKYIILRILLPKKHITLCVRGLLFALKRQEYGVKFQEITGINEIYPTNKIAVNQTTMQFQLSIKHFPHFLTLLPNKISKQSKILNHAKFPWASGSHVP